MEFKELILSKRFIAWIVSITAFTALTLLTEREVLELATGITMVSGIYIGAESLRKSDKKSDKKVL